MLLGKFMGTKPGKLKQATANRRNKTFNHENIDVDRGKTLENLERLRNQSQEGNVTRIRCIENTHETAENNSSNYVINSSPHGSFSSSPNCNSNVSQKPKGRLVNGKVEYECDLTNDREIPTQQNESSGNRPMGVGRVSVKNVYTRYEDESTSVVSGVYSERVISSNASLNIEQCESTTSHHAISSSENEHLTTDDASEGEAKYDAYLNCPAEHILVGKRILEVLENPPYNFKLFLPQRQILPGLVEYDAKAEIVEKRCSGKVIALLSRDTKSSEACDFINHFAKSLDPVSKRTYLIPVKIDDDAYIPRILQGMYLIRYSRDNNRGFFWDKLSKSIRSNVPLSESELE
ncbi:myeloid differentiation primary response protein MyD88 [Patella vulgata]|uniref:myeloid differentiation primary response protein MyD88 n=1 Tax=Patella vulgata TaxID=6465 RepID=UPI00218047A4|nr:myeloid differentiation primary response protein MyD88 [Patella vulgata]XP_050404846.1 myeloid differentiation primary response protein MyD88 [Patella vulgata]XP_050404847.1 myeloid differentiation primary response protein MyD88 [Patella vulgata]XP_055957351.1 myeloid differentiation primary response protein MyD88 [Patella vulgata]